MSAHIWTRSNANSGAPPNAVRAGNDSDGQPIFIGRAHHGGDLLVAKVVPGRHEAYVSFEGKEIKVHDFEYLIGDLYNWIPCSGGAVPAAAIQCGQTNDREALYIGRAHWHGALTPGKVHPSHGCLYISYGGEENAIRDYEVLVQPETWVHSSVRNVPHHAVVGGYDSDRSPIYVGRANHEGDLLPAKVIPARGKAYVAFEGKEHEKYDVEVLVGYGYEWRHSSGGQCPPRSVEAGHTSSGETLYIGRANHEGSLIPGKVHPSHGVVYIPYGGQEVSARSYEVLVRI